ncbi:uncharacterized protein LOC134204423 [Armigeres subalbatus]|uniref:uncharacterized protein LOC134204423 n=1 Tax=Armigeres subalbatus TaxID=124917 RepID=UPI002ED4A02F
MGETLEEVEVLATEAIAMIESWMNGVKLQIAHHKTEVLLVSNCKAIQRMEIVSAKAMSAIARIMPNVGGPRSSTRRLLASVSSSILRYGVPAWGNALEIKRNRRRLQSAFRLMAIRVASAYRTISSEAVCVIAGMVPICISLAEDIECYHRKDTRNVRKMERTRSMERWQHEWDSTDNGRRPTDSFQTCQRG